MNFPPRTLDTMSDAIAYSSPSGRCSKRARKAASEALCMALFGKPDITIEDVKGPPIAQPTPSERAARLRGLARLAGPQQGKKLLAEAAELERVNP